jgi:hypothetical protein
MLAPHVINRRIVYMFRYDGYEDEQQALFIQHLDEVDYVLADALHDFTVDLGDGRVVGGVLHDLGGIADTMAHEDFGLVVAQDGLLLFERDAPSDRVLAQTVRNQRDQRSGGLVPEPVAQFGDAISLLEFHSELLEGRRFRLTFKWTALQPLDQNAQVFAVSRLAGLDHSRYPHLPTLALHPTYDWRPGEVVVEQFDVALPETWPSGTYDLFIGWYDSRHLDAAVTDSASRVGEEIRVGTLTLN